MSCALTRLHDEGVSISGNLRELIARSFTEGVTTSPTIFVPALVEPRPENSFGGPQWRVSDASVLHVSERRELSRLRDCQRHES